MEAEKNEAKKNKENLEECIDFVLSSVNLRHVQKQTITAETPLMQGGLSLDSLDILELVVCMEKKYKVKISGAEEGKEIFRTIGTVAEYLQKNGLSQITQ